MGNISVCGLKSKPVEKNDDDIVTIYLYGSTVKKPRNEAIDEYM